MKLYVRAQAERDMNLASTWYEQQRVGLGQRFLEAVITLLKTIRQQPHAFAIIGGNVRRAPMRIYPYSLFYLVDQRGIQVLRCLHQHRNPSSWPGANH